MTDKDISFCACCSMQLYIVLHVYVSLTTMYPPCQFFIHRMHSLPIMRLQWVMWQDKCKLLSHDFWMVCGTIREYFRHHTQSLIIIILCTSCLYT